MIRTMLKYDVDPEQSETVVQRVLASRILEASIEHAGALSCEMLQDVQHPGTIIMLALWESEEAYAGWRNHPSRAEIGATLDDLGLVMSGSVYEIRTSISA